MNERPAPAEADARRWACATLGVAEDASVDAIRAAFLKQIGEADFYPPADSVIAWQSLTGAAAANPRARRILSERVNDRLRTEVEQFADRFFSVGVTERVKQWFDLNSRCQSTAALTARLEGLSAGLHIDREAVLASLPAAEVGANDPAPSERAVAAKTFDLFVLRPVDRAERQQELLEGWQADLKSWQTVARKFKKQLPKIAALDAEFVDTILDTPRPAPRAASSTPRRFVAKAQSDPQAKGRTWTISFAVFVALMCTSTISRCVRDDINLSTFKTQQQQKPQQRLRQQPTIPTPVLPLIEPINPRQPTDIKPIRPGPVDAPELKKVKRRRSTSDAADRARERAREFMKDPFHRQSPFPDDRFSPPQKPGPAESPSPSSQPPSNQAERVDPPND